jgi:hypothetical protein
MSPYWSQPIVSEARSRREHEVREHLQARELRSRDRSSTMTRRLIIGTRREYTRSLDICRDIQRRALEGCEEAQRRGKSQVAFLGEIRQARARIVSLLGLEPVRSDDPLRPRSWRDGGTTRPGTTI